MQPDNDMGNPDNITTETVRKAAKAAGNANIKEVVDNFIKTYNRKIKNTPVDKAPVA